MAKMTNTQRIEASREARLWIGQVLVPVLGITLLIPEAREWAKDKAESVIGKMKDRFRRR